MTGFLFGMMVYFLKDFEMRSFFSHMLLICAIPILQMFFIVLDL